MGTIGGVATRSVADDTLRAEGYGVGGTSCRELLLASFTFTFHLVFDLSHSWSDDLISFGSYRGMLLLEGVKLGFFVDFGGFSDLQLVVTVA